MMDETDFCIAGALDPIAFLRLGTVCASFFFVGVGGLKKEEKPAAPDSARRTVTVREPSEALNGLAHREIQARNQPISVPVNARSSSGRVDSGRSQEGRYSCACSPASIPARISRSPKPRVATAEGEETRSEAQELAPA